MTDTIQVYKFYTYICSVKYVRSKGIDKKKLRLVIHGYGIKKTNYL